MFFLDEEQEERMAMDKQHPDDLMNLAHLSEEDDEEDDETESEEDHRHDVENNFARGKAGDEQTVVVANHHHRNPSKQNFGVDPFSQIVDNTKMPATAEHTNNIGIGMGVGGGGGGGFRPSTQRLPPSSAHGYKKRNSFHDKYKLIDDHLGSGAYACVRTAIDLKFGQEYAVKLVNKHEHGHTRSRILREVQIFRMCQHHSNIVQLVEWFEDESCFYMVFEKMRGGPLLNHIQRRVCFTEQEASLVTRDIANALKFLHDRGIAHRDVKPENILCTELDKISPVKLCDLDLASKPFGHNENDNPGKGGRNAMHPVQSEPDLASPVGSAEFMAPEVVDTFVGEALKYDKRCDMWSLGVIIYIMLCGYPPFYGECDRANCGWDQGESCADCQENLFQRIQMGHFDFPDEEWKNISAQAKDLIRHLLVRDVRQRYTADDVLAHPWVTRGAPKTPLQTATNLSRNDSARDMRTVNEHFLMMNRVVPIIERISQRLEASGQQLVDFVNGGGPLPPGGENGLMNMNNSNSGGLVMGGNNGMNTNNNLNNTSTLGGLPPGGGGGGGNAMTKMTPNGRGGGKVVVASPHHHTNPLETCQNVMMSQMKRQESKQDMLLYHHHRQANRETQVHV